MKQQECNKDAATSRSSDIEKNFEISDLMTINKYGIPRPRDFSKNSKNNLKDVSDITNEQLRSLSSKITGKNNKKSKTSDDRKENDSLKKEKGTLKKYKNILNISVQSGAQTGSGIAQFVNPLHLVERIKLLGGSIIGGNESAALEFISIAKSLNQMNILPSKELDELLKRLNLYINLKY